MNDLDKGRLEGLKHAVFLLECRRFGNRPPGYLAALDEMQIFLEAAIGRVQRGESMLSSDTTTGEAGL